MQGRSAKVNVQCAVCNVVCVNTTQIYLSVHRYLSWDDSQETIYAKSIQKKPSALARQVNCSGSRKFLQE